MFWRVFDCFFDIYHLPYFSHPGQSWIPVAGRAVYPFNSYVQSLSSIIRYKCDTETRWVIAMVEVPGSGRQGTRVSVSQGRRYCRSGCLRRLKPGLVAPNPRQQYLEISRFEIPGLEIHGFWVKPEKMQADSLGEDAIALDWNSPGDCSDLVGRIGRKPLDSRQLEHPQPGFVPDFRLSNPRILSSLNSYQPCWTGRRPTCSC